MRFAAVLLNLNSRNIPDVPTGLWASKRAGASTLRRMTWALAALTYFAGSAAGHVDLSRGTELPGQALRYWSVEDTVLDPKDIDVQAGGSPFLPIGGGKTLLIRFGDLRRVLGPNKRIAKASILFTVTGGVVAPLSRAGELLVPWGEGPAMVLGYGAPAGSPGAAWSATWRFRRSGESPIAWQQPGASGVGDARPMPDVRSSVPDADHVRVEGLAEAVQRQYDRPYANFGFAFNFEGSVEFASSQNQSGRPVLELDVEDAAPAPGPDLAVVRITRSPEYPIYSPPATVDRKLQGGVEVAIPGEPGNLKEKHWPDNGEEVAYSAVIRNVGDKPATGFMLRWIQRERVGSAVEFDRTVEPGRETTVTLRAPFRAVSGDHRVQPLGLLLEPKGEDADPSNNGLTIHEGALSVGFRVPASLGDTIAKTHPLGARTVDEWCQAVVALWNDVIFPQSQFSVAPSGVLERLRLQQVEIADSAVPDFARFDAPNLDLAIAVPSGARIDDPATLRRLLKAMGAQLGLADLGAMNLISGVSPRPEIGGKGIDRYSADLFPGLMGGGDTRFDGFVPPMLIPPYEPLASPIFDALPLPATDLLSATDAAALNAAVGHRRGFSPAGLFNLPPTVILKVTDLSGLPVGEATVEGFPMANGSIRASEPQFKVQTGAAGTVALPSLPSGLPADWKGFLATLPTNSLFGRLDPNGRNGVLLLQIKKGETPSYAFLKAWQLADAYRRSPSPAMVFEVRVDVGADVDRSQNLAKNRIVSDSANTLPAKLLPLVDESEDGSVELGGGKDAWIEIDLGRDRAFGEVRLAGKGPFWERFTVMAYATGQTFQEAKVLAREANWTWTYANRSEAGKSDGVRTVSYRSAGLRARYIRIVRNEDGPAGSLAEVMVHPLKASDGEPKEHP